LVAVIVVSILKTDFALPTIGHAILAIRDSRQVEQRYQQFSTAFEQALSNQPVVLATDRMTRAIQLAAQTVAKHLLTMQALA